MPGMNDATALPASPPGGLRPRILVTRAEAIPGEQWSDYEEAIARAGGEPIPFDVARYAAGAGVPAHDGLVTTGGVDVDPARYGEGRHGAQPPNLARDEAEFTLTRRALDDHRPLLAICRGAQLLNVVCGGWLHQHLANREPHRGPAGTQDSGWHDVQVAPGTLLARIAGAGPLHVNSRHHQAITAERIARELVGCARTVEGGLTVIEAIEVPGHPFALGVQWHPERVEMRDDPARQDASTAIFTAFVAACAEARERALNTMSTAPTGPFLTFGYGSSLDGERMRATCPSAQFVSIARLPDHRLAFSIESKNTWLGGVADARPAAGDEVWGALWLVDAADSRALDEHEGLFRDPPAYHRTTFEVTTPAGDVVRCRSYAVVEPDPAGFPPSPAFMRTLLRGARQIGLPEAYIARLTAIPDNGREVGRGGSGYR